jgi:hypothetical protein
VNKKSENRIPKIEISDAKRTKEENQVVISVVGSA